MMRSVVWSICLALLSLPQTAHANDDLKQKLVGVWKLESLLVESVETKERRSPYGEQPNGYLIITNERLMTVITGQGRKAAQTDEERAALLRTMFAYTGNYKVEGDQLITKVDVSWNESWVGSDQARMVRFEGEKLLLQTIPAPSGNQQTRGLVVATVSWTKSK
jgi:hypothetical protein